MCIYVYIYTHTHTQSVKSLDTPPHLKCFFFIFMTIYIIDCRYEWTHMEDRFFIIATLWFEYCFAHWHSLCELHEVVTWNGFLFTGVPCRIYMYILILLFFTLSVLLLPPSLSLVQRSCCNCLKSISFSVILAIFLNLFNPPLISLQSSFSSVFSDLFSQVKSIQFYLHSPMSQFTNLPQGVHSLYSIQHYSTLSLVLYRIGP